MIISAGTVAVAALVLEAVAVMAAGTSRRQLQQGGGGVQLLLPRIPTSPHATAADAALTVCVALSTYSARKNSRTGTTPAAATNTTMITSAA